MNHNVKLSLIFSFLSATSRGIWAFTVLSGYLYELTKSNFHVGLAEGIQGTAQVIVAIPSGIYLTDGIGRDKTLKIAGVVGIVCVGVTLSALLIDFEKNKRYIFLCVSLALWGAYSGVWAGSLESIYADSVHESEKSKYLVIKFITRLCANAAGPITGVVLFVCLGDTWTRPELTAVFCTGIGLSAFASACLFFFDDAQTLGIESEAAYGQIPIDPETDSDEYKASNVVHSGITGRGYRTLGERDSNTKSLNALPHKNHVDVDEHEGELSRLSPALLEKEDKMSAIFLFRKEAVPYILVMSDVLMGLASGMTVKFFPLFFKNEGKLSPIGCFAIAPAVEAAHESNFKKLLYLDHYVSSCMRVEGKQDELFAFFEESSKIDRQRQLIERRYTSELAFLHALKGKPI
ncbi:hypothetical protein AAMO2058_000239700 [Amorphochlora amoebiformis]